MGDVKRAVIVLGAGIIGLQTAFFLLEAGFDVTMVAKHWPGDEDLEYTSPSAGAQWRANLSPSDSKLQEWGRETFLYWMEFEKRYSVKESGLQMKPAVLYWDSPTPESLSPLTKIWWSSLVPSFQVLSPSLIPDNVGIVAGITYKAFCIFPTQYLKHLLSLCEGLGLKRQRSEIKFISDLFQLPFCESVLGVVNCTGLSARNVVGDTTMYPTKGQVVIVRGEAERIGMILGGKMEAYAIPRPSSGTTVLGGCKLAGDWSTTIDHEITHWILERCRDIAPDLLNKEGKFDVLSVKIARRPSREAGPRLELEWIELASGEKKFICHNYGHSHSGFEESVGTAREATKLVQDSLAEIAGTKVVLDHLTYKGDIIR